MIWKIKRILEPALANKKAFLQNIIARGSISLYWVINIFLIQKIVWIAQTEDLSNAWSIAIVFAVINIFYIIYSYFTRNWRWINIDNAVQKYVQRKYMKKFNDFDNIVIESFWTWKIISILNKWISVWSSFIFQGTYAFVSFFITLVALLSVIYKMWNAYNIIFFLIALLIINVAVLMLVKKTVPYRKEIVEKRVVYDSQFVKMVMSKFEILQNNRINKEIWVLDKYYQEMTNNRIGLFRYAMFINIIPDIFMFIVYFLFLVLLIYSKIPFALVLSFFMLLTFFNGMLRELLWFYDYYTREFYSIEKLWDFMDTTPEIRGLNWWEDFVFKNWDIEINNITFWYWDTNMFENFSMKIQWWKVSALVWESGWWKSTLIKLLAWFIEINSWDMLVDWQNFKDFNLMSYYKNIWYLTQDPSVFDWTVLDNLTYWAKRDITDDELKWVIKLARCEFIYELEKGLNTVIWERWVMLSWWQKQRLAIAKIFIKNPDIVFLDEPTSALDSVSEKMIQESFANLFKWRTVIIIAHRLQTVKNADEIFVIEKWKIIESWNHDSLVKLWWHYKEMLDLQSAF